jgi:hypothetical protein
MRAPLSQLKSFESRMECMRKRFTEHHIVEATQTRLVTSWHLRRRNGGIEDEMQITCGIRSSVIAVGDYDASVWTLGGAPEQRIRRLAGAARRGDERLVLEKLDGGSEGYVDFVEELAQREVCHARRSREMTREAARNTYRHLALGLYAGSQMFGMDLYESNVDTEVITGMVRRSEVPSFQLCAALACIERLVALLDQQATMKEVQEHP